MEEHTAKEKTKARKSGSSLLSKVTQLGLGANIFAAAVYWEPTHRCHRVAVYLPSDHEFPDVDGLIRDALPDGPPSPGAWRRHRLPTRYDYDDKEKAKARKSGPSLLNKTIELGDSARIFAATIYWEPTHRLYESFPKLRSTVQSEQELAQSSVQCHPEMHFILFVELLTYHAAKQQNLLEKELSEQQVRNHDLINHLSWWTQQFDEMAIERDVLRLGLDQHKEDILQKMKDLAERDRTIATQNYLLGLAHVDAQKLAVTQQKCEHTINVLKEYIAGLSINGDEETVSAKKRKVSP
ncbi:hypothetical protein HJFPF1_08393 [Paramyrothecium foliicola]|nr:hypothetical protein HJFPF1_08393 [Paramyrothecium foliicola]